MDAKRLNERALEATSEMFTAADILDTIAVEDDVPAKEETLFVIAHMLRYSAERLDEVTWVPKTESVMDKARKQAVDSMVEHLYNNTVYGRMLKEERAK